MTEVMNSVSWAEANQAYLVAEFARVRARLAARLPEGARGDADSGESVDAELARARAGLEAASSLDRLTELFGLSGFEREVLLLCAGVEMDSQLAALCGEAQGQAHRPYASFGLALAVLADPHWSALTMARPLRRLRLVEVERGQGLTAAALRIDERMLHYLAGVNLLDPRLETMLQASPAPYWIASGHEATADVMARMLDDYTRYAPVLHLCGDDASGQEDVAALAAQRSGRTLFVVRAEDLPTSGTEMDQFATLWEREALLLPGALLVQCGGAGLSAGAGRLLERLQGLIFLSSSEPVRLERAFLRFEVNKPLPTEQRLLWQAGLGLADGVLDTEMDGTLDDLSGQFRLSARMIAATGSMLGSSHESVRRDELWKACRALARPKLEDLAQRIVPSAGWDDLVLPAAQMQMLRHLVAQVRHRMQVYEHWGFSNRGRRGLGISTLFTGESGTGKTMASEVLAGALGLDVYRIDLSSVVSKYIGETEKNLRLVFDTAEEGGVLLLFDEADALFGKRGDVKDSHDRYANIEVGYLLQRMEAYQGLAVLTTNLRSSMDKAFQRRLRFTVHFPFPDAAQREAIWSRVFPAATPTRDLDWKKLAQLNVTGGNIRNIALNAAFLAAQSGGPVEMTHLAEAAQLEAQKIERSLSAAEVKGWV
jgi:hypothetical protein